MQTISRDLKISAFNTTDDYVKFLESPEKFEGKEVILMTCPKCGEPIYKKLADGYEVAMDCSCQAKERVERRIKRFQKLSITNRNDGMDTFKNACFDCEEERKLYGKSAKYSKAFKTALERNCGLMFMGSSGNGKTFLANCICNAIQEKGYSVLSFTLAGYLRTIKDGFNTNENTESKILQAVKDVDLLFIDDLGSEQITENWGIEKIFSLIDERYRAGKPILITTNLTIEQLEKKLEFNGSCKITDRIYEMAKIIPFTWKSKRKKKQKGFWEEL